METISLKLDEKFARNMEKVMRKNNYSTKTEFIREAIREKVESLGKEQKLLEALERVFGSSKHKTTDEDLHRAREKLAKEYEEKFK